MPRIMFARPSWIELVLIAAAALVLWVSETSGDQDAGAPGPTPVSGVATVDGAPPPLPQAAESGDAVLGSCNFLDELPRVRSAVVVVLASAGEQSVSQGTAFHTGNGRYVTAAHVVLDPDGRPFSDIVIVSAPGGRAVPATIDVVGEFSERAMLRDLAVLIADPIAETVEPRAPTAEDIGRDVRTLGYAISQYGFDRGSFAGAGAFPLALVSPGAVVTMGEKDGIGFVQADNHVEPGMSGGPLVDECGRALAVVIGLPTSSVRGATDGSGFPVFISVSELDHLDSE